MLTDRAGPFGIDQWALTLDRDRLGQGSERHGDVDLRDAAQPNGLMANHGLKSFEFDCESCTWQAANWGRGIHLSHR